MFIRKRKAMTFLPWLAFNQLNFFKDLEKI